MAHVNNYTIYSCNNCKCLHSKMIRLPRFFHSYVPFKNLNSDQRKKWSNPPHLRVLNTVAVLATETWSFHREFGVVSAIFQSTGSPVISLLCDSSYFCDHCSTYSLWRREEEAAKKTPPTRVTAYLIRGASSSSTLTADPWDARFLPRSLWFFFFIADIKCWIQ